MINSLRILVIVCGIICSQALAGGELPPLGKRAYIIDSLKFYDISKIVHENKVDNTKPFLKDPIFSTGIKVAKGPKRQVVGKSEEYRPARLQFRSHDVKGRYAIPRVGFSRRVIGLNRVDEAQGADPIGKIFKSASDLDIDL